MPGNLLYRPQFSLGLTATALLLTNFLASAQQPAYTNDVQPILAEKCYVCHGPSQQQGGIRMDRKVSRALVLKSSGTVESELVRRITSTDPAVRMPPWPASLGLSPAEIETLKKWAAQGEPGEDPQPLDPAVAVLFRAVDRSDVITLRKQLSDRKLLNVRDTGGATLLMHASLNEELDCMKVLLGLGADPNLQNTEGATALIWAADDPSKVALLLASEADVKLKTRHGSTALLAASLPYDSSKVISQLLAKGAQVDVSDTDGWTPLTRVASSGNVQSLRLLLTQGASPNAPSGGLSALNAAVWFGNLDAVRLLLKEGAAVNATDGPGFTALSLASVFDRTEIADALINAGASVNLAITKAEAMRRVPGSPLMLAAYAEARDPAMVKMLLAHGADVSFTTTDHETSLGRARVKGQTPVVAALLEAGAKEPAVVSDAIPAGRNTSPPDLRTAVERSLALLQRTDQAFFKQTGCKSCHSQSLPAMAMAVARERGFHFDQQIAKRQSDTLLVALDSQREKMLQWMDDEGPPLSGGYALAGLAAQGYQPNSTTAALVRNIAARQLAAGNWHPAGARPPIEYSDVSTTAFAVRAMRSFGAGQRGYETRIDRARAWLTNVQPAFTEESVFQLLGLHWAQTDRSVLKHLTDTLLAQQREDGGWSQLSSLPSDAYATGQVLCALSEAGGISTHNPAFQRGIRYLRETQLEDGSWLVKSHVIPIQPYFDARFPHGSDQFISAAGTSWAAMALMRGGDTSVH